MNHSIHCAWNEEMAFSVETDGHTITLDADDESGGRNKGPRPKKLILAALAGCTGMDIIYMLKKMKVQPDHFNILVDGELTDKDPKYYRNIRLRFQFAESDRRYAPKIEKAAKLSYNTYCGVTAQLKKASEVSYEIEYL